MDEQNTGNKVELSHKSQLILIIMCWAVYTIAYIGRYTYTANGVPIMKYFSVNKEEFGLATTFFFFAYGAGQIINGIFCRKYNMRFMVSGALVVSGIINGAVFFGLPFSYIKYIWLVNGFCQSIFWSSLIRILSCYLDGKNMKTAMLVMSTCVTIGTLVIYGISALFALFDGFKYTFLLAAALLTVMFCIWLIYYPFVTKNAKLENLPTHSEEEKTKEMVSEKVSGKKTKGTNAVYGFLFILVLFGVYAIISSYVKDGLTTWVPDILNKKYDLSDSLSIILTLVLPIFGLCGATIAVFMNKYIKDFSDMQGFFFVLSAVATLGIVLLFDSGLWYFVLILLGLVSLFMNGVNTIINNIFPLSVGKQHNAGMLAGVLNGACYVGSALSQYIIPLIEKAGGWGTVMNIFLYVFVGVTALSFILFIIRRIKERKINLLNNKM